MIKRSTHKRTRPTMSPIHSTISSVVAHTCVLHDSTASSNPSSAFIMILRTFHFTKYNIPISLPKFQPVSYTVWHKKSSFGQLMSTIYGLLKFHSVADLILLIARKLPIKTFTAQQEATKFMHNVQHCVFYVNHLQEIVFLNLSSKTVNV